ncbi:MAG: bifunctional phosphoglucose/phosphomannose isomerase [Candidatus Aenigmarchaeota archaeon]|nr:bifunctional phosphoglucose/phosphomannose isomerase [Candidatus Aenigmarchaeota archaeon]
MYDAIMGLPDHLRRAMELPLVHVRPEAYRDIREVVFIGMGGSGIAGNFIRDLIDTVPITLSKSYTPPRFLDGKTLAICTSYSGNTKETVEAYHAALKKNCRVLGITSGGKLLELLVEERKPHVQLPAGLLPRVSLPFQLIALLRFFETLGMTAVDPGIADFVEGIRPGIDRQAREIAARLGSTIPFIYGTRESVALRFKTQLNENAKTHAKAEVFPELNHNEVVAWQLPPKGISVILLREEGEKEEVRASIEFLKEHIGDRALVIEAVAHGKTPLERLLSHLLLGDLVSYHLAVAKGVDPVPVEYINTLKKIIREV